MTLGIATTTDLRIARLTVAGELDIATADAFARAGQLALDGLHGATLIIDTSTVTFIDATGVGALVVLRTHAMLAGNAVVVAAPSRCVARILALTNLSATFAPSACMDGPVT